VVVAEAPGRITGPGAVRLYAVPWPVGATGAAV
jgi:hypothetical protein